MITILTQHNKHSAFLFHSKRDIHVKGYAYVDECYLEGKELIDVFLNVVTKDDFIQVIKSLNGIFAVIINLPNQVLAAVDKYGVFELYYSLLKGNLFISDYVEEIIKETNQKKINIEGKKDYLYCGFIIKGQTLIENIHSLPASNFLHYQDKLTILRYKFGFYEAPIHMQYHEQKKLFDEVVHKVARRFVSSLDGKEVYVPLSGGADSRFIILLLKKMNYQKVTCFSYGNILFGEDKIAKKVALKNGYSFINIPYKRKLWKELFKKSFHKPYLIHGSNLSYIPHLMDYFAALKLKGKDVIIVPGHIGSVAESYVFKNYTKKDMINKVIDKYMFYYSRSDKKIYNYLYKRVAPYFDEILVNDTVYKKNEIYNQVAYELYRSNHIFRALKPYDYQKLSWRVPMMDEDIITFMDSLPLEDKGKEKIFFKRYINDRLQCQIPYINQPQRFITKVLRNITDKRYSCIKISDVKKFHEENVYLPSAYQLLYRVYRNFLTYIALKTVKIIEGYIDEL